MIDLVAQAEGFAKAAHFGQLRKYTNEHYWTHCREVAYTVSLVNDRPQVIAAAWLHDVLEDTEIERNYLELCFGQEVTQLVVALTDVSKPSDGNREVRKEIDRKHLIGCSANAATIKLADLIDNCRTIVKYDKDFAKLYLREKWAVMQHLEHGNTKLFEKALYILRDAEAHLVQHTLGKADGT